MSETMIRCNECGAYIWATKSGWNDRWREEHLQTHSTPVPASAHVANGGAR